MRTLDDFPIGSTWEWAATVGHRPIHVVNHCRPRPSPRGSIDYFVYVSLDSGAIDYCLVGSKSFEEFVRLS